MVCRRSFSANSSETNLRIEDGSVQSFSNSFLMSASCSFIDTKIQKTIQTTKQKRHLFYWKTIIYQRILSTNERVTEPIKIVFINNAIPQILYIKEGIWVVTNFSDLPSAMGYRELIQTTEAEFSASLLLWRLYQRYTDTDLGGPNSQSAHHSPLT